ncbi:chromate transporter [Thermanaerovibrio acidaminovorans]|uniref:chromate transporter n=1 Tax=Thermanaerovibrio acidaminovorans TaxID=81462 RepID=UPI002490E504|nr:chromate transporter [Thermanaerovibrio acidaminovorans]
MELISPVLAFLKVGLMAFGGGISTVPIIRHQLIARELVDPQRFLTVLGLSQTTPGPLILNAATLVGYEKGGLLGSVACTLSSIAMPLLALWGMRWAFRRYPWLDRRFRSAVRGPITALMGLAVVYMGRSSVTGPIQAGLFALSLLSLLIFPPLRRNPPVLILASGLLGILLLR